MVQVLYSKQEAIVKCKWCRYTAASNNEGVLQGSCLDPLLFLLCIDYFSSAVRQGLIAMFVDDI